MRRDIIHCLLEARFMRICARIIKLYFGGRMQNQEAKPKMKRIYAFDLVESMAIIMACSLHYPLFKTGSFLAEIWQLLCIGAVPAFFMINGCLLFSKPFSMKKQLNKIVNIIFGVLFWKTLILILFVVLHLYSVSEISASMLLTYYFTADRVGNLPVVHMWFMYALLSIYILFPIFKLVYDQGHKQWIMAICVLGILLIPLSVDISLVLQTIRPDSDFPGLLQRVLADFFPLGSWGWYLVFFLLGPYVWEKTTWFKERFGRWKLFASSLALLVVSVLVAWVQDWLYQGSWTWTGAVLPLQYQHIATIAVAVSFIALAACFEFKSEKAKYALTLISSNTLTIYFVQYSHYLLRPYANSIPDIALDADAKWFYRKSVPCCSGGAGCDRNWPINETCASFKKDCLGRKRA